MASVSGFLLSLAFHLLLLLLLACIMFQAEPKVSELVTVAEFAADQPEVAELIVTPDSDLEIQLSTPGEPDKPTAALREAPWARVDINVNDLALSIPERLSSATGPPIKLGSDFEGRTGAARAALVASQGGTPASEAAVSSGLAWLAKHQDRDGSWSFDHWRPACGKDCTDPGDLKDCRAGATAMALLAFLGAGQTPKQGFYKKTVGRGFAYLIRNMKTDRLPVRRSGLRKGAPLGDLRGHTTRKNARMYAQGLATLALCEVYAMTREGRYRGAAQSAVNFIIDAQDPVGGGWRYEPRQPGDLSVTGWQLMALTSARIAGLKVPDSTLTLAGKFLNHVQSAGGAFYGYSSPKRTASMTAVGLLCCMYLGWTRERRPLQDGVTFLSNRGPAEDEMYYNYYATQVLHHWGGEKWKRWNEVMREQLIKTQDRKGHATGSWKPRDRHGHVGGRLYMTSLCVMTLEVYYRHLPLYQRDVIQQAGSVAGAAE
ncbi:MAG: terpene cyclase/mutase family protein [Planctomycetes bacterium]|nr:terpene cyclase/mutase family protein [Planctomycetota bacterium]